MHEKVSYVHVLDTCDPQACAALTHLHRVWFGKYRLNDTESMIDWLIHL